MKRAERPACAPVERSSGALRAPGGRRGRARRRGAECPISDRPAAVQAALQVDGTPPRGLRAPVRPVRPCSMLRTVRLAGAALAAAALLPAAPALGAVHTVAAGETLWGIAQATGLSAGAVAAANGLSPEAHVVAGTTLTIPAAGAPGTAPPAAAAAAPATAAAPAATGGGLRVRWGGNLSTIAARNGVSLARLAAVNGLDPSRPLLAGTTLHLPAAGGAGASAAPATTTSAAPAPMGAYEVRPGDTLGALAARSRVPLAQMAFMNGLDPKKPLLSGTVFKIPTGSPVPSSAPAPARTIV